MVEKQGNQAAGEKQGRKPWTLREFGGKTIWDWMGLLIVPVVLSLITVVFALWQDARQDQIESKRAKAERELAKERAQDEALQVYLDQMGTLLLERDLRSSTEDNATEHSKEARTLARARTLTVLGRLEPSRKTAVMQFLVEGDLVQSAEGREPIIALGQKRGQIPVAGTEIVPGSGTDLNGVALYLADLSGASLSGADLSDANLFAANLSGADLFKADLFKADLSDANLNNAQGITNEELEQQAASLKGATMPNGQKYEDWRKSKDRQENGRTTVLHNLSELQG
jgi:hypothetical protein